MATYYKNTRSNLNILMKKDGRPEGGKWSFDDENRKVVRGGSWKDVAYFLRVSSRDYEYSDTSRSYIGFRTVQDYLGSQKVKMK